MKIHLVGHPRSGSTVLHKWLTDQLFDKYGEGEVLSYNEPFGPEIYNRHFHTRGTFEKITKDIQLSKHCVMMSHITHLMNIDNDMLEVIKNNTIFVRLMRRNIVDTVISWAYAYQSSTWCYENYIENPGSISLDEKRVYQLYFEHINNIDKLMNNKLKIKYDLNIFYEDDPKEKMSDYFLFDKNIDYTYYRSPDKKQVICNYNDLFDSLIEKIDRHFLENPNITVEQGIIKDVNLISAH